MRGRGHVLAMKVGNDKGTVQYVDSGEILGTHSSQIQCIDSLSESWSKDLTMSFFSFQS